MFDSNTYEIEWIKGEGHLPNLIFQNQKSHIELSAFLDTKIGLCLTYNQRPNAILGLELIKDTLYAKQIQGITGYDFWNHKKIHPKGLQNIHWKEILIRYKQGLAKTLNIPYVGIISSKNLPFKQKNLYKNYDELAKKMNYQLNQEQNWIKKI